MFCRPACIVGHYQRSTCRTCGHGVWLASAAASESPQCGRCRMGVPPTAPAKASRPACPICFETGREQAEYTRVLNESWQNDDRCDAHGICEPCLQTYIESKVVSEGLWNLRCPGEGCRYRLVDTDIQKALANCSKAEEALNKFEKLRADSFQPRLEEVLAAQAVAQARGKDEEVDATEAMLLNECQVCPTCAVLVRREGGCTHIVCRCSQDFCFGCGAPMEEDDDSCVCDHREDAWTQEDDMEGEGRPSLGFWRQWKAKEAKKAQEAKEAQESPSAGPIVEEPSVRVADSPEGDMRREEVGVEAEAEQVPAPEAPLLLRAISLPQGKRTEMSRRSRSVPLSRARR